jgi:phosphocarrier protein
MPGDADQAGGRPMQSSDVTPSHSRDLPIVNKRGLHARAAAKFVQCAERYEAVVTVSKDQHTVGGTSIMGLMMLTAGPGSTIHVAASGADAESVLDALAALVADRFGEGE